MPGAGNRCDDKRGRCLSSKKEPRPKHDFFTGSWWRIRHFLKPTDFARCNAPPQLSTPQIQPSTSWFEGSWECGFSVQSDCASTIYNLSRSQESRSLPLQSSLNPEDKYIMSISWERIDMGLGSCAESTAGSIRS